MRIVTAGTITGKREEKYVLDAVQSLSNPERFNYYIKEFEEEFARYIDAKYALATVNGTAAMHLGLLALGIGEGDEVIIPDMTYIACANVIHYCGATPVVADIYNDNWCLSPESIVITNKTKAIMPVWMYGQPPAMATLKALNIPLIEDACPAVGSFLDNQHAGTFGDIGCFSFQGAKILAIGEGGMLVTNREDLYFKAKYYADMYETKEFWHERIGYMYGMNNVSAAVGLGQLEHIDELLEKKRLIYERYKIGLGELILEQTGNHWMTSILVENRIKFRTYLKEKDIDTRPFFYPISSFGIYKSEFPTPVSYSISMKGVNLPSATYLSLEDIDYVISQIKAYYQENS